MGSSAINRCGATRNTVVKDKILKLICNTDTLQTLIDSNHKFCALDLNHYRCGRSTFRSYSKIRVNECPELSHLFEINIETSEGAGGSVSRALRRKIRSFYFRQSDFDVTYFIDMEVNLLPYVLDLVTRIEYRDPDWLDSNYWTTKKPLLVPNHDNLGGIYQLVRNCPVGLFGFPSPHVLLKQKDESILNLELANKALRQQLEEQAKEIEQLKKLGGPTPPNKRAKTSDNNESRTTGDIESRFAALEADVALLKQKMK